jgi:UDP-glucose 4-epimerase
MSRRVLVTGGFGYLGGRIAVALAREAGYTVRLGSRTQHQAPAWLPEAETAAMDVANPASLSAALQGVEAVVHLAATNENECAIDPAKAVLINTLGTANVLQSAINAGVARLIYFSTAHVYGGPLVGDITEHTLPRPIHPYAITHHAAEDFVLAAHDQKKITGIVVRLSNGFGAPIHPDVNRWTLLVNDLCRQAVQTHKMVLRSSGLQQRNFITLEDVGRAVLHLLEMPKEKCGDGLFNLGGDTSLSVWEMTRRIAACCQRIVGFTPEISRPEPRKGEESRDLIYRIDKLNKTGFRIMGHVDAEIEATLQLCNQKSETAPSRLINRSYLS